MGYFFPLFRFFSLLAEFFHLFEKKRARREEKEREVKESKRGLRGDAERRGEKSGVLLAEETGARTKTGRGVLISPLAFIVVERGEAFRPVLLVAPAGGGKIVFFGDLALFRYNLNSQER